MRCFVCGRVTLRTCRRTRWCRAWASVRKKLLALLG